MSLVFITLSIPCEVWGKAKLIITECTIIIYLLPNIIYIIYLLLYILYIVYQAILSLALAQTEAQQRSFTQSLKTLLPI
jgi:hypothetical protein